MSTLFRVIVARIRAYLRPSALDRELDEELAAHLAMAEEDKIRLGMTPEQARRAARVELGGLTQLREACREARGLPWLDTLWLDAKLGLRMLRKSWGLTLVGGLAMTVVMVIGLAVFTFFSWVTDRTLPLDDGDRVVAIEIWDHQARRAHEIPLQDFERWRDTLGSLVDIGAFRTVERNFTTSAGAAGGASSGSIEPVAVAEITAVGLRLARVAPLLGRSLVEDDQVAGAAPVAVIGFEVWQSRFAADPAIVGRTIRLDGTVHTVVGVMPEGFAFPVDHRFWTPLRMARSARLPVAPAGLVFARLAPGVTHGRAQAELTAVGLLPDPAARQPDEPRLARVVPYAQAFTSGNDREAMRWVVRLALTIVTLLLVPPCANIAILVYARTVTRQEEFAARYALGASRHRIVGQLLIEMLVLAVGAALMALVTVRLAIAWAVENLITYQTGRPPFWIELTMPFGAFPFAVVMALVAGLVAGLAPALKATGRAMRSGLHTLGSRTRLQLGATWTALVVVQVALTLAALPAAIELGWGTIRNGVLGPGFAAEEYLTARIATERGTGDPAGAASSHFTVTQAELIRRLQSEPGISGVTVATLPGEEPWEVIEVDRQSLPQAGALPSRSLVRVGRVDQAFLEVFDLRLLTGRGFGAGDFGPESDAVLVNQTFVRQLVGDRNPLGVRVRYAPDEEDEQASAAAAPRPWYQIVGVVADRPAHASRGTVYRPSARGQAHPASLALRVRADPAGFAGRLRRIAADLDPTLRVSEVLTLEEIYRENQVGNNLGALTLAAVTFSVLLLSAAGMYALMSFTVNQRRREIGIRSALGAPARQLLAGIFKPTFGQLAAGALGGILIALALDRYLPAEAIGGWQVPGVIPGAVAFMVLVGLLAVVGPARRGLRVDPIEELRQG